MDINKIFSFLRLRDYLAGRGSERLQDSIRMQNLLLDNLLKRKSLGEPGAETKQLLAREKEARQSEREMVKFLFGQLRDLVKDPEVSPATREYYSKLMENQYFSLDPRMREILIPLAKGTPIDPIEQKRIWFDRHYKPPTIPKFDPEDPLPTVKGLFDYLDFKNMRSKYMGLDPGEPDKSVALGNGVFGYRDSKGKITIMTADDERLREIAKGFDTTSEAILANGGRWPTAPWMQVQQGRMMKRVRPMLNVLSGEREIEVLPVQGWKPEQGVRKLPPKMPESLTRFLMALGTRGELDKTREDKLAKQFLSVFDDKGGTGIDEFINKVLKPSYPGWAFKFVAYPGTEKMAVGQEAYNLFQKGSEFIWGTEYSLEGDDWNLVAFPYTRAVDIGGKSYAYHEPTDSVYDGLGRYLGSHDKVLQLRASGAIR